MRPRLLAMAFLLVAGRLHAQTGGQVEGRVTNTLDGQPVRKALVTLRGLSPNPQNYLCQTDAGGNFQVKDVAPGLYEAEASRDGFQGRPPDRSASTTYVPQFKVAAGQQVSGVALHLTPLGAIAGKILDETGHPVALASVEALEYVYVGGRKVLRARPGGDSATVTDDRGEYRFYRLPPGRYYLRASKPDRPGPSYDFEMRGTRPPKGFAPAYYPGVPDASQAAALDVAPGGELAHVDIRIRPQTRYVIRGAVAPDASVGLQWRGSGPGPQRLDVRRGSANRESFETIDLPPGWYALIASRVDPATHTPNIIATQRVQIVDRDIAGIDLNYSSGKDIAGAVQVTGPATLSPESFHAILQPDDPDVGTGLNQVVKADGTFVLRGVLPGEYRVRMSLPASAYLKSVRVGDRELPTHRFDPERDKGALTFVVGTDVGRLDGSVTDAKGNPAPRVRVTVIPDQSIADWVDRFKMVLTGPDGQFQLSDMAPGNYRLYAWKDVEVGAPQDPEFRKPYESQAVAVRLDAGGNLKVTLTVIESDPGAR